MPLQNAGDPRSTGACAARAVVATLPAEAPDAACAASEAGAAITDTRDDDASPSEPPGASRRAAAGSSCGGAKPDWRTRCSADAKGARTSFSPAPAPAAAKRRASKHVTREDRTRALLAAAASGDAPMVRAVTATQASTECADERGFTRWRWRRGAAPPGAARVLLAAGADPAAVVAGGVTPARAARANGHAGVLRLIRDALGESAAFDRRSLDGRGDGEGGDGWAADVAFSRDRRAPATPPITTPVPVPPCAMEEVASGVGAVYGDGCFDDRGERGDEPAMTKTKTKTKTKKSRAESFLDAVDDLADVVSGEFGPAGACSDAERLHFADAEG